jgi:tetratricopeptide (TPR) repeat protein
MQTPNSSVQPQRPSILQDNLRDALNSGNYYEAHQLYLSMAQRHLKQKKMEEALDTLQEGIHCLGQHGQMKSVSDIAEKLLGMFEQPWRPLYRKHIIDVLDVMQLPLPSAKLFIKSALKVAGKLNHGEKDPQLHAEIGRAYLTSGDIEDSLEHFSQAPNSALHDLYNAIMGKEPFNATNRSIHDISTLTLLTVVHFLQSKHLQEAAQILDFIIDDLADQSELNTNSLVRTKITNAPQDLKVRCFKNAPLLDLAQLLVLFAQRPTVNQDLKMSLLQSYKQFLTADLETKLQTLLNTGVYFSQRAPNTSQFGSNQMGDIVQQVFRGFFQTSGSTTDTSRQQSSSHTTPPDLD